MNSSEIIQKYKLDKHTWIKKGLHTVLHTMYPATTNLLKPLKEYWGDSFRLFVFFVIDDYLYWYYNEEDMSRLRKQVVKRIEEDTNFAQGLEKDWKKRVAKFEKQCKKIDGLSLNQLSDAKLLQAYKEFYDSYVSEYALAMGLLESFSFQADQFLKPMIERYSQELDEHYPLLLSPIDPSFINLEYLGRLKIMRAIKQGEDEEKINRLLESHASAFHWVENNYAKVKKLEKQHFLSKIKKEMKIIDVDEEIQSQKEQFESIRVKKEELMKKLGVDTALQNLIRAVEIFAKMQDDRKKCVLISNYYQLQFLEEIAKRSKLPKEELEYTVFNELPSILSKKYDTQTLRKRKKATLSIETLEEHLLVDSKVALEVFDKVFEPKIEKKEIKGMCASKGSVTGVAKIINKTHDLASVNSGDILVTSMTRPDMITALEKASGIVTDEGGVTCHAAVISREFGIPCVIATKIATKVIQNGDKVEVDATKGTVRIINK